MSNRKISQMTTVGAPTMDMFVSAIDPTRTTGDQNIKIPALSFAGTGSSAPTLTADGTTLQSVNNVLSLKSVPLATVATAGAASGNVLAYNGTAVAWAAAATGGGLSAPVSGNTVTTMATSDDIAIWSGGAQKYITLANLVNSAGQTISQGTAAGAVAGTNKLWINQGGSSDVVATMAQVLAYIQASVAPSQPSTKAVTGDYTLTVSDNGLDLVCTAALTVSPPAAFATLGDGWKCRVVNGTPSSIVTLASGISSAAGSTLAGGTYASLLASSAVASGTVMALVDALLILPPGVPTGLAAGTVTDASIAVSWVAATSGGAPTSYTLQYRTDPSGAWTQVPGLTSASYTITGLTASTAYDIEVQALNGSGTSSFSAAVTASTSAPPALLLDSLTSATTLAAFSLRKLRGAYAGSAAAVRNSDGTATQDIGFDAEGDFDSASAIAFAAANGGTAYIGTVYDQSGNGAHMVAQGLPVIATSGAVATAGTNNRPTIDLDSNNHNYFSSTSGAAAMGDAASVVIGTNDTAQISGAIAALSFYGATGIQSVFVQAHSATRGDIESTFNGTAVAPVINGTAGNILAATGLNSVYTTGTSAAESGQYVGFGIGAQNSGASNWVGPVSEFIVFSAALSSADQAALYADQKSYFGTP